MNRVFKSPLAKLSARLVVSRAHRGVKTLIKLSKKSLSAVNVSDLTEELCSPSRCFHAAIQPVSLLNALSCQLIVKVPQLKLCLRLPLQLFSLGTFPARKLRSEFPIQHTRNAKKHLTATADTSARPVISSF